MYYELTKECIKVAGRKLYRIRALIDMPQHNVKAGDLGGFVESWKNLMDYAWIADNAKVFGNAYIADNVKVCGSAMVYDSAVVWGDAQISGNARIYGEARVYGKTTVSDNAKIYDQACVYGEAEIKQKAQIFGNSVIYGNARVYGNAMVYENARAYHTAQICGNAEISGEAAIYHGAEIYGNACLGGDVSVGGYERIGVGNLTKNRQLAKFGINSKFNIMLLPEHVIFKYADKNLNIIEMTKTHKQMQKLNSNKIKQLKIPRTVLTAYKNMLAVYKEV